MTPEEKQFAVECQQRITLIEGLYKLLDIKTPLARIALSLAVNNVAVLEKKQRDYGPSNLVQFGPFGIAVRSADKVSRLGNLLRKDTKPEVAESLTDTWSDLANYALIGQAMQSGHWKGEA